MTKGPEDPGAMREINHRFGGRAVATAKIAGTAARLASRRLLGREDGAVDGAIGEGLARELDRMKGLAMKVGQILSYFEGVLPAETHEALRRLQKGGEPVTFEVVATVIEEAFGLPVATLFDSFDEVPVAAASIGQVHRAVHAGASVAVKVRYPNVRETFEADFERLSVISRMASLATAVDGPALVEELRARIVEECDYLREADHQEAFARAFAAEPGVLVPAVVRERTRVSVLTTAWQDGEDFYAFAAHADRERRSRAALLLARFAYRSLFQLGTVNADPHPGNYLFPDGEAVAFLDFGCIRRFEPAYLERERELARVVVHGDRGRFREALLATGMVPHPKRFDFDAHWELLRHQLAPYIAKRFHFTFDYVRAGFEYSKPNNPNLRRLSIPPAWIWTQRLQWGLHAVLARLDAEGPFHDVFIEALESEPCPLDGFMR